MAGDGEDNMPEQIQTPDFQKILEGLDLGFTDPSELIGSFVDENKASAGRIRQARMRSERDPRNIVDKIAPFAEMIGFLIDSTSGSRSRRQRSIPALAYTRETRNARLDKRRGMQRQKYLDRLAEEEMLGAGRARNFNAQRGGVQSTNINKRATATAAGQVYSQKSATARSKAVNAPSSKDIKDAEEYKLAQSGYALMKGPDGLKFWDLDSDVQTAMTNTGYNPPQHPVGVASDRYNTVRADVAKQFRQLMTDAEASGDPEQITKVQGMIEAATMRQLAAENEFRKNLFGYDRGDAGGFDFGIGDTGVTGLTPDPLPPYLPDSFDLGSIDLDKLSRDRGSFKSKQQAEAMEILNSLMREIPGAVSDR